MDLRIFETGGDKKGCSLFQISCSLETDLDAHFDQASKSREGPDKSFILQRFLESLFPLLTAN